MKNGRNSYLVGTPIKKKNVCPDPVWKPVIIQVIITVIMTYTMIINIITITMFTRI